MKLRCGLVISLLAWAGLAACSPTQNAAIAATGALSGGPASVGPCADEQSDTPEQGVAACTGALAAQDLSNDQRAQFLNVRGQYYCHTAQYDLAIADQTEAIRLEPEFDQAYVDRGGCYVGKGDLKTALADYDEAIRLAPSKAGYLQTRGNLRVWTGDPSGALADYNEMIRRAPHVEGLVDARARLLFGMGRFHEAAEQFVVSARQNPTNPYPVLWLHMARARAHEPDDAEFQAGMKRLDPSGWPAQIFDMFLGKATPDATRELYASSPSGPADGNCETVFFVGEYYLLQNQPARARDLFGEGTGACQWQMTGRRDDFRFLDDWAELIRLNPAARGAGPLW